MGSITRETHTTSSGKMHQLFRDGRNFMTVWESDAGKQLVLWVAPGTPMIDVNDAAFHFRQDDWE